MRKIFLSIMVFALFSFVVSRANPAVGLLRYTTCDACGLCPTIENGKPDADSTCTVFDDKQIPGDWKGCVKCLYPTLYPILFPSDVYVGKGSPLACSTLVVTIDPSTGIPVNLVEGGRQFTLLGCVTSGATVGFNNQTGASSFVQKLLDVIFSLAGGLAFLYLMYGAFIVLTSQADPERLNYGKRLIYGAIVGLIITIGSVFLVNLIGSGILRIPGFSGAF